MFKARFVQTGNAVDYTANADIAAGDVVAVGEFVGIAKIDIPANTSGALATTGVFEVVKAAEKEFNLGDPVYWSGTEATSDTDNGKTDAEKVAYTKLGVCIEACAADSETVLVRL